MDAAFAQLRALQLSIVAACELTGRSRATHYRRTTSDGDGDGGSDAVAGDRRPRRPPPSMIAEAEREQILALLSSEQYRDLAIPQVWARELDEGRYWCSQSSMYRIARAAGQVRERRAQATHPPRVRPELVARGPSEVWSWDITALKGPTKGEWYKLYVSWTFSPGTSPGGLSRTPRTRLWRKISSPTPSLGTWRRRRRFTPTGVAR